MSKTTLDEILHHLNNKMPTPVTYNESKNRTDDLIEAKQAILRWVADEVIGGDEADAKYSYLPPTLDEMTKLSHEKAVRNQIRSEQRKVLVQHGYKGDQR